MDRKYILKTLRPLKLKIYLDKAVKILFFLFIIAGVVAFVTAFLSLFVVIPFVRYKIYVVMALSFLVSLFVSLFFIPSQEQVIRTADSLGLKERVITAWYLINDDSTVARLQRQDAKNSLENADVTSTYKIKINKNLYIPTAVIITTAFLLTFIPGKVFNETRLRESLVQQMNEQEKLIEEEISKQEETDISEEQLNELKEALEKLKKEFKKSKSEEDALKALTQMENLMEKLKDQDPLKDLNALENALNDSLLTRDLMEGLRNEDAKALQEAMEQLEKKLESEEQLKELSEMLQAAAMNMESNSILSEAIQNLASMAASGSMSGNDIAQSLMELMQQTGENAASQQDFQKAISDVSQALSNARRSISAVDQKVASGNPGQNSSNNGQQGAQTDSGGQQSQQTGNSGGQNGSSSSQGEGAGSGAGQGSTNSDAGYKEGDEPGQGGMPGSRKEEEYRRIYVPNRLGGEGNETALSGQKLESGSSTYSEADGAPVQKGELVPYQEVLSEYREEAVQTMDRQNIPTGLKELVKDYFSSLN